MVNEEKIAQIKNDLKALEEIRKALEEENRQLQEEIDRLTKELQGETAPHLKTIEDESKKLDELEIKAAEEQVKQD